MVVLDAIHRIQAEQAPDLAVRWNCKAGKCGSCSAEINGMPKLMCMTRLSQSEPGHAGDRRADARLSADPRPGHRRLLELPRQEDDQAVQAALARCRRTAPGACSRRTWTACRNFASASSASSARTSATCCASTTSTTSSSGRGFFVYAAALEMHPLDTEDRVKDLKDKHSIGYCNITTCCRQVCPESITITENAIIPLKERVVDRVLRPAEETASHPLRRRPHVRAEADLARQRGRRPGESRALPAAQRTRAKPKASAATSCEIEPGQSGGADQSDPGPDRPDPARHAAPSRTRSPPCRSLDSPYDRAYYAGIAWERRAKARHQTGGPGAHRYVYEWIVNALQLFEEAEPLRVPGNDDALLRWNACVRFLNDHRELAPAVEEVAEPIVSE